MDSQVSTTLIRNVRLFTEGELHKGAVAFSDGIITAILFDAEDDIDAFAESAADIVIDGKGCMLLPGAIDAHVHFREPGLTNKADIASESIAAAAGGVTTVLDMPNVKPTTTSPEALKEKLELFAQKSAVNYGIFYGITNENIDEALAIDQQDICGYKVFLGSSTGGMLMNDASLLRHLFSSTKRVIAIHSESEDIIKANKEKVIAEVSAKEGRLVDDVPVEYHPIIRSTEACVETTKSAIELAKETNANLHICHITTAAELQLLNENDNENDNKNITAEACVAHLWFTDEDYKTLGTKIKCNPAIKTKEDRDALRAGLSNGLIDTIATDHAPHCSSDKIGGAIKAASGMPSIQFSLLAMLELVKQNVVSLETVVKLMCESPAERYGIADRGFIRLDAKADLVLVSDEETTTVTKDSILSKCGWSPFEGTTFSHKIVSTWVNGVINGKGEKISYII